jgi:putative transposase
MSLASCCRYWRKRLRALVAYPLSLRHLAQPSFLIDRNAAHSRMLSAIMCGTQAERMKRFCCSFAAASGRLVRAGRMDETYIRVKGEWRHLYRAVDKDGNTIDFLLRAHRDKTAARRYFEKSIAQTGVPETVTIDKSGANLAALEAINDDRETPIKIRRSKYLNNLAEQDHRAIKRRTRTHAGIQNFSLCPDPSGRH